VGIGEFGFRSFSCAVCLLTCRMRRNNGEIYDESIDSLYSYWLKCYFDDIKLNQFARQSEISTSVFVPAAVVFISRIGCTKRGSYVHTCKVALTIVYLNILLLLL